MTFEDESRDGQKGQPNPQHESLADSIKLAANKDTRQKPWQSIHDQHTASAKEEDEMKPNQETNTKDDYWMAEGFVNASS